MTAIRIIQSCEWSNSAFSSSLTNGHPLLSFNVITRKVKMRLGLFPSGEKYGNPDSNSK